MEGKELPRKEWGRTKDTCEKKSESRFGGLGRRHRGERGRGKNQSKHTY